MERPRIFLGSSGRQAKLIDALTRGLGDIALVEPWTTSFDPGVSTLERLLELTQEVDFAAFVFAQDDWTTSNPPARTSQASPRDNVVFEAGLFGGVLGMRRTFILHADGAKLPTDLLGLTSVRYAGEMTASEVRGINAKLRKAIENQGRFARVEGAWWHFSLTERTHDEPSVLSLLRISRDRGGALQVSGRGWDEDGRLTANYWSEAVKERQHPPGVFYYWRGERPLDPICPRLEGTAELLVESDDRASLYFITQVESDPRVHEKKIGVCWRADPGDVAAVEGRDNQQRIALISRQLSERQSFRSPLVGTPRCEVEVPKQLAAISEWTGGEDENLPMHDA